MESTFTLLRRDDTTTAGHNAPRYHAGNGGALSILTGRAGGLTEIYLPETSVITNVDVKSVQVLADELGAPALEFKFTPAGAAKINAATKRHVGKPLAILVDGDVVCAPVIRWELGEAVRVHGIDTFEEAERIARSFADPQ